MSGMFYRTETDIRSDWQTVLSSTNAGEDCCTIGVNTASPKLTGGKLHASFSTTYTPSKDLLISAADIRSLLDFSSVCKTHCTLVNPELRTTDNGAVAPPTTDVELVNEILTFKDNSVGPHSFFI